MRMIESDQKVLFRSSCSECVPMFGQDGRVTIFSNSKSSSEAGQREENFEARK